MLLYAWTVCCTVLLIPEVSVTFGESPLKEEACSRFPPGISCSSKFRLWSTLLGGLSLQHSDDNSFDMRLDCGAWHAVVHLTMSPSTDATSSPSCDFDGDCGVKELSDLLWRRVSLDDIGYDIVTWKYITTTYSSCSPSRLTTTYFIRWSNKASTKQNCNNESIGTWTWHIHKYRRFQSLIWFSRYCVADKTVDLWHRNWRMFKEHILY